MQIQYQPIGSGRGLTEVKAGVVDFAVSDAPLDGYQLLREGLAQFPVIFGGIVPVYNVDGIGTDELRFTGELLADIYLGKVHEVERSGHSCGQSGRQFAEPCVILVVDRSDGSGTTFNWTDYLSKVSDAWKYGSASALTSRGRQALGAEDNMESAEDVACAKGAIGYVEFGYALAKEGRLRPCQKSGRQLRPAADVEFPGSHGGRRLETWSRTFDVTLSDASSADAYPITACILRPDPQIPEGR